MFREEVKNMSIDIRDINQLWLERKRSCLPPELTYADDCDFITEDIKTKEFIEQQAAPTLQKGNLFVNQDKTEITTLKRENHKNETWRTVKKLGSLLGDSEDISNRKKLASVALIKTKRVWFNKYKSISLKKKIKLYNLLVKSILLYNCSTWGLTKNDEKALNSFHRQQLRQVLGIKCPHKINCKTVYKITNSRPISIYITERRWKLLGHILRLDANTPARKSMKFFFEKRSNKKYPGRKRATIYTTIQRDIHKTCQKNPDFVIRKFKTEIDLHNLGVKARNKKHWRRIVREVVEAAYSNPAKYIPSTNQEDTNCC